MKPSLARIRHARSKKDFPFLTLEEGEYVELHITRSKFGLILIWVGVLFALAALGACLVILLNIITSSTILKPSVMSYFWIILCSLCLFLLLAGLVASKIYLGNKLFVTNKRLIHYSTQSLFAKSVNIIELSRIEDVSFKQTTFLDHLFSYGTIRMSTVGDETTYTFPFVDTPKDEIDLIAHLIHKQKGK